MMAYWKLKSYINKNYPVFEIANFIGKQIYDLEF